MNGQKKTDLKDLNAFLRKNKDINFRTADLLHTAKIERYNWKGLTAKKEQLVKQLKAYQRMLRVVPDDRADLAKALLKKGFQSALQITNTPRKAFIQKNLKLFDNNHTLAEQVYKRALVVRKAVALQYVARVQQAEPHARAVGFVR